MDPEKHADSRVVGSEETLEESFPGPVTPPDETVYPPLRDVILISIALYLALFLVALVRPSVSH